MGKRVADKKQFAFYDMDDTIPESMKEKMRKNELISQEERDAYTQSCIHDFKKILETQSVVVSAVLLKERQREEMCAHFPNLVLINLVAPKEVLLERLTSRPGHFFKASTLEKLFTLFEDIRVPHTDIDATQEMHRVEAEILGLL